MVDIEDQTGKPDSPEVIDEVIRVVARQMTVNILKLPPELAVQMVVIHRALKELRKLRIALDAANQLIGQAADEAKRLQDQIDRLKTEQLECLGCGDVLEPSPIPSLCVGCVNEALQRGIDPDPKELKKARDEQG